MEPSDKQIQTIKDTLEKVHNKEFTWEEATKAAWDIQSFARILYDMAAKDMERQNKLKESPKGFHLEEKGYTCQLCGSSASYENSWFDKYGLKCMVCQDAINKKIIPASIAKDKKSYYTKYDLEMFFPPKKLLKSKGVKVMKDGEEYYTSEYWYEFVDEKLAKKIAKYQIAAIFPYSFAEPIDAGHFYAKSVNPLFSY